MNLSESQQQVLEFVKIAHGDQVRKYTGEPYWHHLVSVAKIVNKYCPNDFGMIEIALCHDLFEDTVFKHDHLVTALRKYGYDEEEITFITRGVIALTDVWTHESHPDWNRATRKEWECNRLSKIYKKYQTIKYADIIDNTISIIQHDKGFAKKYLQEKRNIIDVMRLGNLDLLIKCYKTLIESEIRL